MRLTIFLLAAIFMTSQATAQVYRYTDSKGNTVFTDQPPEGASASKLELAPINNMPAVEPQLRSKKLSPATSQDESESESSYAQLTLANLSNDDAIRANDGNFSVQVNIKPSLSELHKLQLLIDGQAHGKPGSSLTLQASGIDRGEHSIAVQVLADGNLIQQSDTVTVHVIRASVKRN